MSIVFIVQRACNGKETVVEKAMSCFLFCNEKDLIFSQPSHSNRITHTTTCVAIDMIDTYSDCVIHFLY